MQFHLEFSKITLSVLVTGLSDITGCFSSAACRCFPFSFFMMSQMSVFMMYDVLYHVTNLRAFFTCPCSISLQKAFWSDVFWF